MRNFYSPPRSSSAQRINIGRLRPAPDAVCESAPRGAPMRGCCGKNSAAWKVASQHPRLLYSSLILALFLIFLLNSSQINYVLPFLDSAGEGTTVSSKDAESFHRSFTDVLEAYGKWDAEVGCTIYREKERTNTSDNPSLQDPDAIPCHSYSSKHVSILVKRWRWIPNNVENLYSCSCGMTCLWTKSKVLVDKPDAELYETTTPPYQRRQGEPLRVYMDLEAGRSSTQSQDIFVSYHAGDTVQTTYAGASFHIARSYFLSSTKNNVVLVYWSSSRCLTDRMSIARELLSFLPHHSFGRCLNNVGGRNKILSMYPECKESYGENTYWAYHLHCAMSYYKFVLAIENTITESYVTEKLFYALDSGAVPIYFGAPNVLDFIPPNSIIDGSKFASLESLALYVKSVATDPVLYAGYHAWRRCGVMGNYYQTRALSLDSLPCRLCATISKFGGRNASGS